MPGNIDISLFSDAELDETFPREQFKIRDCKLFRTNRNKHGGVLCFRRIEVILVELSFKSKKWLCIGYYKPPFECDRNKHGGVLCFI